jgi:hypothetical protein
MAEHRSGTEIGKDDAADTVSNADRARGPIG